MSNSSMRNNSEGIPDILWEWKTAYLSPHVLPHNKEKIRRRFLKIYRFISNLLSLDKDLKGVVEDTLKEYIKDGLTSEITREKIAEEVAKRYERETNPLGEDKI